MASQAAEDIIVSFAYRREILELDAQAAAIVARLRDSEYLDDLHDALIIQIMRRVMQDLLTRVR